MSAVLHDKQLLGVVPEGSGAAVVHRALGECLHQYSVRAYPPKFEYCPPLLPLWLRKDYADLIHTTPDCGALLARKDAPLVITFHNFVLDAGMRNFSSVAQRLHYATDLRMLTRLAVKRAAAVTAVSQFTADLAQRELGLDKTIEVIPNGVDSDRFTPGPAQGPRNPFKVLFGGNLTRRKGVQWLDSIARKVATGVELWCASGLREDSAWINAPNIRLLGSVPHERMPELYRSIDVFLLPTVREGMSLGVLEAMASGVPVIATRCSSVTEQVHAGKGGILCELGDTGGFADAINTLAEDRELASEMGMYNRQRVLQAYTLSAMCDRYERLFERTLGLPIQR